MNEQEIIKRNIERINARLSYFINAGAREQKILFNKLYKLMCNGKECTLDDIDFNKSVIFTGRVNFLALFSYFGLLKVNGIKYPDTTIDGTYSFLRKTYMVINSDEIRFSKIPQEHFYDEHRDVDIPDSWNSINFYNKDVCIWRLIDESGMQDNSKMYSSCCSWIENRFYTGKINWIFYFGERANLKNTYSQLEELSIPIYEIIQKGIKQEEPKKEVTNLANNGTKKRTTKEKKEASGKIF